MLKIKPTGLSNQVLIKKKLNKRSTSKSTSKNKQNVSIIHNASTYFDCNKENINSSALNIKNNSINTKKCKSRNGNEKGSKSKKTNEQKHCKKSVQKLESKQHQIMVKNRQIPLNKNMKINGTIKNNRPINCDKNQTKIHASDNKFFQHNQFHEYQSCINDTKRTTKIFQTLKLFGALNIPQISKSSTILTNSTGNIQFSEYSNDDQLERSKNKFQSVNNKIFSQKNQQQSKYLNQQKICNFKKYRKSLNKAAILIQKTWRGYLTRKLLQEYIESFEPMYKEQLIQIRSGNQSACMSKSVISTNNKKQQKSSFFDRSQLQECSEIGNHQCQNFISSSRVGSIKKRNVTHISKEEIHNPMQNYQTKQDFPVQMVNYNQRITNKKTGKETKPQTKRQSEKNSIQQIKLNTKQTPETCSRISQFTVKNNYLVEELSLNRQKSNQETKKFPDSRNKQIKFCPKLYNLTYNPKSQLLNQKILFCKLHSATKQLQTIFQSFNLVCINQLKSSVKQNHLNLAELMQRKQTLKDIVQNGKQFVLNVENQIGKALKQMERVTQSGLEESRDRKQENSQSHQTENNSSHRYNQNSNKKSDQSPSKQSKYNKKQSLMQQFHQNSHQRQCNQIDNSSQSQGFSSSGKKYYSSHQSHNKKLHRSRNPASEFYTIELPTEEYSIKGKSPIQEQLQNSQDSYEQQHNYENQQEQEYQDGETNEFEEMDDQQMNGQEYINEEENSLTLNKDYQAHRQSFQILNQFLLNLIEQFTQLNQAQSKVSELDYLCQTLKRVSCDTQNKTIIDRCLIEFIVQMMSQTFTLNQIYQAFKKLIYSSTSQHAQQSPQRNRDYFNQRSSDQQSSQSHYSRNTQQLSNQKSHYSENSSQKKLTKMIKRWIQDLQKWEMNIIHEVPSKMQSSSFINTQNMSFNQLRDAINNLSNISNS